MNEHKTAEEIRDDEIFREFFEKYRAEALAKANESSGEACGEATEDTEITEEFESGIIDDADESEYPVAEAEDVFVFEDENPAVSVPDSEPVYESNDVRISEYEDDKVIERFSDLLPDEILFSDEYKSMTAWQKIKHILSFSRKKENCCHIAGMIIPGFLLLLLLFNMVTPSKEVSSKENRTLAQFPEISASAITGGSFMKDFETYINDQFVFRNTFVSAKRKAEKLMGKKENHGILIGDDGYLIENTSTLTKENIETNLRAVEDLASLNRYDITLAVLPTAYEIMADKLPAFAYTDEYSDFYKAVKKNIKSDSIQIADISEHLDKYKSKYLYYRTDHHQTAHGSYYSYEALGKYLGYEAYDADDFKVETVATDFYGTTWSNSGFAPTSPDEVYCYTPKKSCKSMVEYPLEDKKMDSMYDEEMLKGKDKYAYYLGGNHALTVIKSKCESEKRLVIIKDSYAHSIAPFLANHYSEIHMIDLRYFNDDVLEYLCDTGISDVLFLYNQNTFMTDTNLSKISTFTKSGPYGIAANTAYGSVIERRPVDDSYFEDAVFIGDSITAGMENFSELDAKYMAVVGMTTMNISTRKYKDGKTVLEALDEEENVGKVYIMLGSNEVSNNTPEDFIERYMEIISSVRESFPDALVYVESITPVGKNAAGSNDSKVSKIRTYNEHLLKMTEENECYYIDLYSYLADEDGYLPDGIATDGVHFTPEKYTEIADYLRTHAIEAKTVSKKPAVSNDFKGGGKADTAELASDIYNEIEFKDKLDKISNSLVISQYNVDKSKVCDATVLMGGGSTAEEVAVFELTDEKYAAEVEPLAKERIENKKKDFETYKPAEMKKLNNPVVVRKGNIVAVCIADKVSEEQIENCIK